MNAAANRPAARKSKLAGANPITSAAPTPPVADVAPEAAAPAPPVAAQAPAPAAAAPPAGGKYRHKVSFYQDPVDTARVRGAVLHTMLTEGNRTLSQFLHDAVMAEVERLEAKYNAGQPFPAVGPGDLPQGRPMGE